MNAYELADELKYFHETLCDTGARNAVISGLKVKQLESMLRQQAGRIAELEKENKQLKNILSEIDRQIFNVEIKDDGSMVPVIRMEKK